MERERVFFWVIPSRTRYAPSTLPGVRSHFSASARWMSPKNQLWEANKTNGALTNRGAPVDYYVHATSHKAYINEKKNEGKWQIYREHTHT